MTNWGETERSSTWAGVAEEVCCMVTGAGSARSSIYSVCWGCSDAWAHVTDGVHWATKDAGPAGASLRMTQRREHRSCSWHRLHWKREVALILSALVYSWTRNYYGEGCFGPPVKLNPSYCALKPLRVQSPGPSTRPSFIGHWSI